MHDLADNATASEPGIATPIGPTARLILLTNLVAEVGIILTGGLVRLTGSGLGCPTWPDCTDGNLVPVTGQPEGLHSLIEFGNRLLTSVVLIAAVAALLAVLRPSLARRFGRPWGTPGTARKSLVGFASLVLVGIFCQALLGGLTVLLDLNPVTVAAHFLLSIAMVAAAFNLYRRAGDPGDQPMTIVVRPELRVLSIVLVVVALLVLALGTVVTGTGPHSGDAEKAARFALDPRTISWLHSDVVLLFIGLVLTFTFAAKLTEAPRAAFRAGVLLVAACATQAFIGYLQYFTGVPEGLVAFHLLGACLVWLATLNVLLSCRTRGVPTVA
ncbi:MAG TPA: COX15/CtaA family protein [Actinomycetes bacterium]|nr:COX15/CtaA family protein [Actinomycetes bacterium]